MNESNEPKTPKTDSEVPAEIPSVVAISQKRNTMMITAFLVFMGLVALLVCRKPTQVAPETIPQKELPSGPSLPPPVAYPRPIFPNEPYQVHERRLRSEDDQLLDIRRKSPIVIFNKTATASASPNSDSSNPLANVFGASSQNKSSSGVPLPANFQPTTTASSHATEIGGREGVITQGKLLDAVLETAVNSDHPGMLRALISHDVYGDTGRLVLLPRGSRLVGQYDSSVAKGQNRVFVIWQRAIRPDGIDIQLASAGTDTLGTTGLAGNVNNHFFTMFGAATLLSIIGATSSILAVNPMDQNNSIAQYRESVTNGFSNAASTVLGQFVQIKPTITIKQGAEIKVFVARDLYFDPAIAMNNSVRYIQ